ncbi:MAG: hypothetical protein EKK55_03535 [Rhodocyclaceae bacterium]|nr:MAG: hypothetical protein EKK55_03535 [Rhodocyclaceae bacterium]
MPNENPPIDENEPCACCTLCQYAGDNQLVYCHQGTWHTLAAPDFAATLGYDPVTGFQWVPVLGPQAAKPILTEGGK